MICRWVLPVFVLAACAGDPNEPDLSQNVGQAFAPCSENEIKYMADRHNLMTAFRPCGQNFFRWFSWSPTGKHLYFQLVMTGYVMDADSETKLTNAVPTPEPIGPAAWTNATRLVVPVVPETDGGPIRLALYDIEQRVVQMQPLPPGMGRVDDLYRVDDHTVLFAATMGGSRSIYRHDIETIETGLAFPWLSAPVDTFSYEPTLQRALIGHEGTVTMYDATTGESLGSWTTAVRGALHPGGEWLVLEYDAAPISIFHQRAWDELSESARARELARIEQFEERLPEGYKTRVRPPSFSLVQLSTGQRWALTGFQGYDWQWYEAADMYASFMFWGFESKQFKRNVMLGNMAERLKNISEKGGTMMGIEPFMPPPEGGDPDAELTER